MNIEIITAKNGEQTAKIGNFFLHSSYSPSKEAERFVNNINCSFIPKIILITEPALSYCSTFLRKNFPNCQIGAIRYSKYFSTYNSLFDFSIYYENNNQFEKEFSKNINEENIFSVLFLSWTPSENAFQQINLNVWNIIKKSLNTCKTLLVTRQFFEKKWFINSLNYIKYAKNLILFNKNIHEFPIIIIASGASLFSCINILKKIQNKFFIIALSSSLNVLLKNNIKPDLCLSTDGGYWANQHLKPLIKNNIPIALPPEAYISKKILQKGLILPLSYSDGISSEIIKICKLTSYNSERNGTVSGTALKFAEKITNKEIFIMGLDLATCNGYQHTQPNILESNSSLSDNKLKNKETRIFKSGLKNESLEIYEAWFKKVKTRNKVYRVIDAKKNTLENIKDIKSSDFFYIAENFNEIKKTDLFSKLNQNIQTKQVFCKIFELLETEKWCSQLFPLDYININHNPKNQEAKNRLQKNIDDLKTKTGKILQDE